MYDTFIVGFNTVAAMSVSKGGLVVAQLTTPPGGGPRGTLTRRASGTIPLNIMFKVEVSRAEHLYNTLVDRNIVRTSSSLVLSCVRLMRKAEEHHVEGYDER